MIGNRNTKIKNFLLKHKIAILSTFVVLLLACVTILISYAYYTSGGETNLNKIKVGEIPSTKVRYMVENPVTNQYTLSNNIPDSTYVYNEYLSYCVNGSSLEYNSNDKSFPINSTETDEVCFAYFSYINDKDIILNVFVAGRDNNYELSTGQEISSNYTIGRYECTKKDTIVSYNPNATEPNTKFTIRASGKTICNVYMDMAGI